MEQRIIGHASQGRSYGVAVSTIQEGSTVVEKPRTLGSTEEQTKKLIMTDDYKKQLSLYGLGTSKSYSSTKSLDVNRARAKRKKKQNHKNRQKK